MILVKRLFFLNLTGFILMLLNGCNPQQPTPVKNTSSIAQIADQQVKNLESKELKDPALLKEAVLLQRQCAAQSYPDKLLYESLIITRTNVSKENSRPIVDCVGISAENPKGATKKSGDLSLFGVYPSIDKLTSKLPIGFILNIEQRSEKKQESIYPWIIKKP
jgi:hypothetical protein